MIRHVIVHQFDPTKHVAGGIEGFIREMVALAPEEEEIALVGIVDRGSSRLGRWTSVELDGRETKFLPVAHLPQGPRRVVPHTARLMAGLLRYRPKLAGAVIHTHRAEVGAILSFLYPRATHIQFIHGDAGDFLGWKTDTFWRLLPSLYGAFERRAVRHAAHSIVMSGKAVERLRSQSQSVVLGRNWFDGRIFHPSASPLPARPFTIGWIGRLEVPKDPLKAVDVFGLLQERGLEFRAWMAGTGLLEPDVRSALRERSLEQRVELLGLQSPNELADRLRGSHALLVTSRFEGVPRAVVEGLACGVPVVSTDVGEVARLIEVGVAGSIARTGTAAELADLLVASEELPRGQRVADTVASLEGRRVVDEIFAAIRSAAGRSGTTD